MKNFFEFQKQARQKSNSVLLVFATMLLMLLFFYNLIIYHGFVYINRYSETPADGVFWILPDPFFKIQLWLLGALIIGFAFAYFKQLIKYRSDPFSLVYELGGISLNERETKLEAKELRLLNVVEEMCIAAGILVVPVFILKSEKSINAFTAGHDFATAYIVVTQGALDELNRDELQAVVAHEVGHIVSADVKMNSVLLSCIAALTFFVTLGFKAFEVMGRSRSKSSKDDGALYIIVIATVFIIIGFVGALLGRSLQSLFSRRREFLADSLGVQFTRNPSGLAGALAKIRDIYRSEIKKASAMNIAHMCIASPLKSKAFSGIMASHPPINERIKLLDPLYLDPEYNLDRYIKKSQDSNSKLKSKKNNGVYVIDETNIFEGLLVGQPILSEVFAQNQLAHLKDLKMSQQLHSDIEFKYSAWGMLFSKEKLVRSKQISILQSLYGPKFELHKLPNIDIDSVDKIELSTSVMSIIIPKFKSLKPDEKLLFIKSLKQLSEADSDLSDFETIILASFIVASENKKIKYKINFLAVRKIISLFVKLSTPEANLISAYNKALNTYYGRQIDLNSIRLEDVEFEDLVSLIHGLKNSSLDLKQNICGAILVALQNDQILTLKEIESFRAFSIAIGIPSPPV